MKTDAAELEGSPAGGWLWRVGRFVRFSHTVFALPFALIAMMLAAGGWPEWSIFLWILICMVAARTAAMVFNRLMDWEIDKQNPRTADRSTLISKLSARALLAVSILVFVSACTQLNFLCVILSPLAIGLIFFYSVTKRFTSFSHLFLGLALSAAPVGAWLAVRGKVDSFLPFILALAVALWVFGFDLVYSTLDAEFDRKAGLFSFPSKYGIPAALRLSLVLHVSSVAAFGIFGWWAGLLWPYWIAWGITLALLWVEQSWARSGDPGKTNQAFFEVNAVVSILLLLGVGCSLFLGK